MEYDSRIGIAYDTIFYGTFYFNTDVFKDHYIKIFNANEDDFKYFYALKESIPSPPPVLYPFYYCDLTKPSFLADCFNEAFHFGLEDFLSFNKRLQGSPQSLVRELFQYYLEPAEETYSRKSQFLQEVLDLDLNNELLLQLARIWSDYRSVLQALNDFLTASYTAVKELYDNESGLIRNLLKTFKREQFLTYLNTISTINYSKSSRKDRVSISLLNMILIYQKSLPEMGNTFLLGRRCNECVDFHNIYSKISVEILCRAFCDPIKAEILLHLNEKEYTVTQLSEILYQNRQSVNRHALWLLDFMFITISQRKGTEIYYKINRPFFSVAKDILIPFFDKFSENPIGNPLEIKQEVKSDEKVEKTDRA